MTAAAEAYAVWLDHELAAAKALPAEANLRRVGELSSLTAEWGTLQAAHDDAWRAWEAAGPSERHEAALAGLKARDAAVAFLARLGVRP